MNIILASQSPSRKKLLQNLRMPFEVIKPDVDEEIYHKKISNPYELCPTLARLKVESIERNNTWIIGADQMVFCDGKMFGKPKTHDRAVQTLSYLQGRSHELVSGLCVKKPDGSLLEKTTISKLTIRLLSEAEIHQYLEMDQPYNCAGSYKVEGIGISLFEKIETSDFTSIIGLPMLTIGSLFFKEVIKDH